MKKIMNFISKYYFEIFITLISIVIFGVAVSPTIALVKVLWG